MELVSNIFTENWPKLSFSKRLSNIYYTSGSQEPDVEKVGEGCLGKYFSAWSDGEVLLPGWMARGEGSRGGEGRMAQDRKWKELCTEEGQV